MPELTPEQDYGAGYLAARTEAVLGDTPGFGKTGQAITAALRAGAERIVITCPAIARLNWERELRKFGWELPIVRVVNKADHKLPSARDKQAVILSHNGLSSSKVLRGHVNAGLWDVVIPDEAHYLKEPTSNRARAMYGNGFDRRKCLAGKAGACWLLTGSLIPNHAGEIWTHVHALWPGLIGNMGYDEFLYHYCFVKEDRYGGKKITGYRDRQGLVNILNLIMLRRTEIAGLPDLVIRSEPTVLEVEDRRLVELESHPEFDDLRATLSSAIARAEGLEGIEDEFIELPTLRRLTAVVKAGAAAELIEAELGGEDKTVVFGVHREAIEELARRLAHLGVAVVHGGVPDAQRNDEIDRFNADSSVRVFVGNIEACKTAINLPAANRVRFLEASFCPEDNWQAIKRVHRRGQLRQVFADFLALAGSIDELVQRVLALKTRNINALMEAHTNGR